MSRPRRAPLASWCRPAAIIAVALLVAVASPSAAHHLQRVGEDPSTAPDAVPTPPPPAPETTALAPADWTTECSDPPAFWSPPAARDVPDDITGLARIAGVNGGGTRGTGIALFGSIAVVPGWTTDGHIIDISDPATPTVLSVLEDGRPGRDAAILPFPDCRLIMVLATDYGVVPVWDITDPAAPVLLGEIDPPAGSHNVAVVPGSPILYNANSQGALVFGNLPGGGSGYTEIYDLSDPAAPEMTVFRNGYGCHDVVVRADLDRAYCAGIEVTQIWDITDPASPRVIVDIPVHHGLPGTPSAAIYATAFSHLAMTDRDGDLLIVGDETGGGLAPGCDAAIQAGDLATSGPIGNLWFYNISDETAPVLQGWVSADNPHVAAPLQANLLAACTAHFGNALPDRDVLTMGFYAGGALAVDFGDATAPRIIAQWAPSNANVWDAQYYQGYVFTGDTTRGFDVLVPTGSGDDVFQ